MSWIAAGTLVVGAYTAHQQNKANDKALDAANQAGAASDAEARRQFDLTRQDLQPWLEAGNWGLDRQRAMLEGDTSGFENSADYVFAREQGLRGLDRQLASNLGGASGGADVDRMNYATGLANQNMSNYYAKLQGLSGGGYQAGNALGGYGQNLANTVGNNAWATGNARASAYQNRANNNSQLAAGIGGLANNWWQQNQWGGV